MWNMDVVNSALLELRRQKIEWEDRRESTQQRHPDTLAAFCLARHVKGVIPDGSEIDLTIFAKEFYRIADDDDLLDADDYPIDFEDFVIQLEDCMEKVRCPYGAELQKVVDRAKEMPLPAGLDNISNPDTHLVAKVCVILSEQANGGNFYLTQRAAGQIIKKQRAAGGRKLLTLQHFRFIERVSIGFPNRSSYYRILKKS